MLAVHSGYILKRIQSIGKVGDVSGEGVVDFPGTPICQQCNRCGRAQWRGSVRSRKRHAIKSASESKGTLE